MDKILPNLSFEIHFDTDIYTSNSINLMQKVLENISPKFCEKLRVLEFERDSKFISIDIKNRNSLKEAIKAKGLNTGPTYKKLTSKNQSKTSRRFGSTLVYGNARATFFNVSFDEFVPGNLRGDKWLFSNTISGSLNTPRISGIPQTEWVKQFMVKMCEDPAVLWGAAYHTNEFHEKNLHKSSEGMWAIGRDMSNHLPGLYWLNIFGAKYRELIGENQFNNLTALSSKSLGSSQLIELYEKPEDWSTESAKNICNTVTAEIGSKYFFNRDNPNAKTITPDYTFPSY